MDWMEIGPALLLGLMIAFIWPRAKQMLANSPKAKSGDWPVPVLLVLAVMSFVILLIAIV